MLRQAYFRGKNQSTLLFPIGIFEGRDFLLSIEGKGSGTYVIKVTESE